MDSERGGCAGSKAGDGLDQRRGEARMVVLGGHKVVCELFIVVAMRMKKAEGRRRSLGFAEARLINYFESATGMYLAKKSLEQKLPPLFWEHMFPRRILRKCTNMISSGDAYSNIMVQSASVRSPALPFLEASRKPWPYYKRLPCLRRDSYRYVT